MAVQSHNRPGIHAQNVVQSDRHAATAWTIDNGFHSPDDAVTHRYFTIDRKPSIQRSRPAHCRGRRVANAGPRAPLEFDRLTFHDDRRGALACRFAKVAGVTDEVDVLEVDVVTTNSQAGRGHAH